MNKISDCEWCSSYDVSVDNENVCDLCATTLLGSDCRKYELPTSKGIAQAIHWLRKELKKESSLVPPQPLPDSE